MINSTPAWFEDFRRSYIRNYIFLIIRAYQSMPQESFADIKIEEDRRTELVEVMRPLKSRYHIVFPISCEVAEGRKRMDICCYLDNLSEDNYICFECKRFLKRDLTKSHFEKHYYGEGIRRFEACQYSPHMAEAGLLSFLETGCMDKLEELMRTNLPQKAADAKMADCSEDFDFPYVYRTLHERREQGDYITLYHVLLDFTAQDE
ncbi:MAG: hypothetical protein NC355_00065 [Blautia sp.]|nr:hypothetical protein [Blautia sp.]